ncbi:MAG: AAA family ATPase [Bacilli bacterium]|nr:AAA family ATPase [Bacilli bacterium]
MKYALIFRKLVIDDKIYYQGLDKVIGEETFDNKIEVVDGQKYLGDTISHMETLDKLVYLEITQQQFDDIGDETIFLKVEDGEFREIEDYSERANVALNFYSKFHDFRLVPDYDIEKLVLNVQNDLKNKLIGEDKAINKILTKIYNNHMYFEADIDKEDMVNNKSNILLLGPYGCGKSTIKESLKKNLAPIPVVECQLTGNFQMDIVEMIHKLISVSDGNEYLAERGIVIFDGINDFTSTSVNMEEQTLTYYIDTLKQIMEAKLLHIKGFDNSYATFDCSLLTYICMVDIDYDYEDKKNKLKDYLYYTRVDSDKLYELGFSGEMINNCFSEEIIFMEEMTRDLALKILKDKKMSPLYKLKRTLENRGKTLKICRNFVEELVDYGLNLGEGFRGIEKVIKYLVESKDYTAKQIILDSIELHDLQIGSFILDDEEELDEKNDKKTKSQNSYSNLKVDIIKRTINDLSVLDVVSKIKEEIIGQDDQIFSVVNAFFNHILDHNKDFTANELKKKKENILLIGPTGVGKTAIVMALSRMFELPFVEVNSTRYSKAGYVGESVDSILLDLIDAAGGNVEKAQHGFIFFDEIDKIHATANSGGIDMSEEVQNDLLKLIEGEVRTITTRSAFGESRIKFDTKDLFISGGGAFAGIEKITKERVKKKSGQSTVGFKTVKEQQKDISLKPTTDDLEEYGMSTQFTGRFPKIISLSNLDVDKLCQIINNPNGVVSLNVKSYAQSGIVVKISDGFKKKLAKRVLDRKNGARGIIGEFSNIKDEIDKNIALNDIEEVIVNDDCLEYPEQIQYVKRKK